MKQLVDFNRLCVLVVFPQCTSKREPVRSLQPTAAVTRTKSRSAPKLSSVLASLGKLLVQQEQLLPVWTVRVFLFVVYVFVFVFVCVCVLFDFIKFYIYKI